MSLKSIIEQEVLSILQKSSVDIDQISLEVPRYEHGDFSTNIAFKLTKKLKKSPHDIANQLSNTINENTKNFSTSAMNGFLNLKLTNHYLSHYFHSFLKTPLNLNSDKKVLLEYVSANPTGPLHIGHGRWAVIGDCIYRLLKTVGINVSNEFYINDAGNQIKLFNDSINAYKNGETPSENSYGGYFIEFISKESNDDKHVEFTINYQKDTLKKIHCEFDCWFKESSLHDTHNIKETIISEYKDYIYEKDNALWFKTTSFNDDKDRVIVKENGDLTYFAADIVYHLNKINRGYTSIINIWGADHHGYIERIKSCIKAKNNTIDLIVILGQLVNLYKDGKQIKMSKRTGDLIELSEVIDEIGVDATRYFLIEKKAEQHLDFDLTIAKKKTMENPVYYIQYAHARICTIIKKTKSFTDETTDTSLNEHDRRLQLIGARYYDTLIDASTNYEPYKIAQYLFELAKHFHSFYQESPIIYNNKINKPRLEIILTTKNILSHALNILGLSSPEKM